jgi:hypothetical protein
MKEGSELDELKQIDEDDLNDDILNEDDLGFDEETKERFREAVRGLNV